MDRLAGDGSLQPAAPLLVGLAIDVSASMTRTIHNPFGPKMNRLEAFRDSLRRLAERGRDLSRRDATGAPVALVKLFAYGFGFGNPLSVILGREGPPVRDLLVLPNHDSSLVSIADIAESWERYESRLEDLAVEMFGSTPLREALDFVQARFDFELERGRFRESPILFVLSDGMPNQGTAESVLAQAARLRARGVTVVSCYVTDYDIADDRHLYAHPSTRWPEDARLMFDCSSEIPEGSDFANYLVEHKWAIDPGARLFAQINRSDILTEFLSLVISPVEQNRRGAGAAGQAPVEVFFSYAHEDESLRDELEKHLSALRNSGLVATWHDRRITAGREWALEIDDHIESAGLILLLISADFLSSGYCSGIEAVRALERHKEGSAVVIPVILKPVDWEGEPFEKLAMLPADARPVTKWPSRADGFKDVAKGIRRVVEEMRAK